MIERCSAEESEAEPEKAIEIVEAKFHHCGLMGRRMRKVHRDILEGGGVGVHRELAVIFGQSSFRRSAFTAK
jgi:hypothetical protein